MLLIGDKSTATAWCLRNGRWPITAPEQHRIAPAADRVRRHGPPHADLRCPQFEGAVCPALHPEPIGGALRPPVIFCPGGAARAGVRRGTCDELPARVVEVY